MKERILAERYARALLMLGLEEKSLERFQDELGRFAKAVETEPLLLKIFGFREFPQQKKEAILKDLLLKLYCSPPIQNFFMLLLKRGRIGLFPVIEETFNDFVRDIERVVVAEVTVAEEKSAKQLVQELKQALEKLTSKKVELQIKEDTNLIGGLQVSLGDTIYDASIQGELERIKEQWV